MALTRRVLMTAGSAILGLSVLLPISATAEDRNINVPVPVGASVDRPGERTTVNSEPARKSSCPEGYDEYSVAIRVADQQYKRVYQCIKL